MDYEKGGKEHVKYRPSDEIQSELMNAMVASLRDWWEKNSETIKELERIFDETCLMDNCGFIHDKETHRIIAGSKLEWFNKMLEKHGIRTEI